MSADSPVRTAKASPGRIVLPQQVTDTSILEGVAGFINDFVPAAYNTPIADTKDQIQWARFEQCEIDELNNLVDCDKLQPAPILLILGYTTGIQIWAIPGSGEARELVSWRHGSARVLTILPNPEKVASNIADVFASKRPLIALCDNVAPGSDYCSLSFISLKTGEQVKLIKFKNPILDVIGNKRSVIVTFSERIAVFDSFTLEDRLTVTTCYLSPGIYGNPIALGTRWLAYAENKLIPSRRSSGGNDGEGVQSYTATVLHAAKSLGRGLMELGETVASSFTGNPQHKPGQSNSGPSAAQADVAQKGIITILDIEKSNQDNLDQSDSDAIISHFAAHKEAVVCLKFDPSGLLLLTADKRGHDFHLFRIHPHPGGPALAAVHHLYILHRGDTTAKVQDMCFSPDSRWVTVSTLRGTTHVFPITPYGGNVGVRTHATPHVVNKMSRFHRSAGLTSEGRSNSPVSMFEAPFNSNQPYNNPRLPPYPHPTVVQPLAQIRQPVFLPNITAQQRPALGRQRSGSSLDESSQVALRVCACFAAPRAWIEPINQSREPAVTKPQVKSVESLFIMSLHGSLIQYDLDPKSSAAIPKEKVCDDTLIELVVSAKAQWTLQRNPSGKDVQPPLSLENLSLICKEESPRRKEIKSKNADDKWLSQVEIVTHAGPHRRLWMGPQFTFKTYNSGSGAPVNILDTQVVEVVRSKPVNMPLNAAYPILIEAGSVSSCEPSPKFLDTLQRNFEEVGGAGELQLREDLADAMLESPGIRDTGGHCVIVSMKPQNAGVAKVVNPLGMVVTVHSDDESEPDPPHEEIIHENCDEALFRPVVASKAVIFAEPKNVQPTVATNVLHHNKIIDVGVTQRLDSGSSDKNTTANFTVKLPLKEKKPENKGCNGKNGKKKANALLKNKSDADSKNVTVLTDEIVSFENFYEEDSVALPNPPKQENKEATVEVLQDSFFDASEACQDIETLNDQHTFAREFEMSDDLEMPPLSLKVDVFDSDAEDKKGKSCKEKEQVSSSEDTGEEKQFSKKPRKPKAKLGVRISKPSYNGDSSPPVINTGRTWSSVAKSDPIIDLPELGTMYDFAINFPPMNYSKVLKNGIDVEEQVKSSLCEPIKSVWNDELNVDDTLKVEKVFEDNSSNSQTETTESDDSSKIPPVIIMDTEEDPQVETKPKNNSNKNKKSKKKRR